MCKFIRVCKQLLLPSTEKNEYVVQFCLLHPIEFSQADAPKDVNFTEFCNTKLQFLADVKLRPSLSPVNFTVSLLIWFLLEWNSNNFPEHYLELNRKHAFLLVDHTQPLQA